MVWCYPLVWSKSITCLGVSYLLIYKRDFFSHSNAHNVALAFTMNHYSCVTFIQFIQFPTHARSIFMQLTARFVEVSPSWWMRCIRIPQHEFDETSTYCKQHEWCWMMMIMHKLFYSLLFLWCLLFPAQFTFCCKISKWFELNSSDAWCSPLKTHYYDADWNHCQLIYWLEQHSGHICWLLLKHRKMICILYIRTIHNSQFTPMNANYTATEMLKPLNKIT